MGQRIGYPSNSYKVASAGSTPACPTFCFFTLFWSIIMKTFLAGALGFFLSQTLCLTTYILWEEFRPEKPMQFNLMMVPPGTQVDPDKFSSEEMFKFQALQENVS